MNNMDEAKKEIRRLNERIQHLEVHRERAMLGWAEALKMANIKSSMVVIKETSNG